MCLPCTSLRGVSPDGRGASDVAIREARHEPNGPTMGVVISKEGREREKGGLMGFKESNMIPKVKVYS